MRLYHGTKDACVASIREQGLRPSREEWRGCWWSYELGLPPAIFLANRPRSEVGASPLEFASIPRAGDGVIVVVEFGAAELRRRLVGVWEGHDVDLYCDCRRELGEIVEQWTDGQCCVPLADQGRFLDWLGATNPSLAARVRLVDGWLRPDPRWLLARRRETIGDGAHVLVEDVPPECIRALVKVWDGRAQRVRPEFDPKRQRKLKHKRRSFASLFLHRLGQLD